jgi:tetratricopeptide (TPR) repeat protein
MNTILKHKYQLLIVLITFILHSNIIFNGYNIDDSFVIENNNQVLKGIKAIPKIFKTRYTSREGLNYGYRPITKSYFAIMVSVFDENVKVFHFLSIVLLSVLALLIFHLFSKLFSDLKEEFIFLAVLFFISYPANTEVVASLKNNEQLLSSIFSILSFSLILKYFENKKIILLIPAIILLSLGLLSKTDALLYIPIIFFSSLRINKISIKKTLILIAFFVAIYFIYRYFKHNLSDSIRISNLYENPLFHNKNILLKISTGIYIAFIFVFKIIFPYNLKFYYGYKEFDLHYFNEFIVIFALIFFLAFIYLIYRNYKTNYKLAFLLISILFSAFFFSNILRPVGGVFGDRFLFIPSIFFGLLVFLLINKFIKNIKISYFLFAIIIVFNSFKTISRNAQWKSRETLYTADIKKLENTSVKANELYASIIMAKIQEKRNINFDNLQLAKKHFNKAIEIYPNHFASLNNLGLINLIYLKNYNYALEYFYKALKSNPDSNNLKIEYSIAFTLQKLNKYNEAEKIYKELLRKDSYMFNVYNNLSEIYINQKNYQEAISINKKASNIFPNNDLPYINIGKIYFLQNDTATAIVYLKKAYKINPNNKLIQKALSSY